MTLRWLILALMFVSSLAACGGDKPSTKKDAARAEQPKATTPKYARVGEDGVTTAGDVELFEQDGLYGFRKRGEGAIVLPARFPAAYEFIAESGLAAVVIQDIWWLIDIKGEPVYRAFIYDNGPDYMVEGMMRYVDKDNKVGFINARGEVAIAAQFDWASSFDQGVARYCIGCEAIVENEMTRMEGGQWGTVDASGELTVDEGAAPPPAAPPAEPAPAEPDPATSAAPEQPTP